MRSTLAYSALVLIGVGSFAACSGTGSAGGPGNFNDGGAGTAAFGGSAGQGQGGGAAFGGTAGSSGSSGSSGSGGSAANGNKDADVPDVTFSYDAGNTGQDACASVTATGQNPPVDIIIMIDQSGSMTAEIAQVRTNINTNFANIIQTSGLDYRVIMFAAPTGSNNICVSPPLGNASCGANNPPRFYHINQHLESTDSLSKFMSRWSSVQPVLRQEAVKVFIEVTDDQSGTTATTFDNWLMGSTGGYFGTVAQRRYIFHSIIGVQSPMQPTQPVTASSSRCSTAVNSGVQYQDLSVLTKGLRHPVCDTDYSTVFQNLAANIVSSVACEITMPTPMGGIIDPNQVKVIYTPGGTGTPTTYTQVANQAACLGDGFYYDNPQNPTKVFLCPGTCNTVKADSMPKVELELGCLGS